MKLNEEAVFKWVVIVGVAAAGVIAATLLVGSLVGALLGLLLVIAACIHGYRWMQQKRHELGAKK